MDKHIFANLEKCRACLSCENACRAEHSSQEHDIAAMLEGEVSRISVRSAGGNPVPLTCRHCEEPACVDACMSAALTIEAESGRVAFDPDKCVGCAMCVMACPFGVITMTESNGRRISLKCDLCPDRDTPACTEACPQDALVFCLPDELEEDKQSRLATSALS